MECATKAHQLSVRTRAGATCAVCYVSCAPLEDEKSRLTPRTKAVRRHAALWGGHPTDRYLYELAAKG